MSDFELDKTTPGIRVGQRWRDKDGIYTIVSVDGDEVDVRYDDGCKYCAYASHIIVEDEQLSPALIEPLSDENRRALWEAIVDFADATGGSPELVDAIERIDHTLDRCQGKNQ